jgi:cation diffusion facilitator CzcD-associated flavoprotein CzcO
MNDRLATHVAIIGGGMSGILAGIRLAERGIDYTIYEKADRLGGTWRENTYPGITCDVPSQFYVYSFELNAEWSRRMSPGAEILEYLEGVADKYEVLPNVAFGEQVIRCEWLGDRWEVETSTGTIDHAEFVIAATGILHHPKLPDIDGLDSFAGDMFHSARWDHDVELDGRRVGVIGTGSTGVQITGAVVPRAEHFSLFQRTSQWVVRFDNTAFTDEEKAAYRTDADILKQLYLENQREFHDGFSDMIIDVDSGLVGRVEEGCSAYIDTIADPELREQLRPDYRAGCKRLVLSENFYEALQEPNADLVTESIDRIEPGGVRTSDGTLHELDVLVLATGFQVDRFMRPMEVRGEGGLALDDAWSARPSAYMSVAIPRFPNFFMLNGPNSPVGNFSLVKTAEMQFDYVLQLMDRVGAGGISGLAPTDAAAEDFELERTEAAKKTVWATGCRSWYLDDRGIPFAWPFTFARFTEEMAAPQPEAYQEV